jgi:hypothetical protein
MKGTFTLIIILFSFFTSKSQSITITQPNGGEVLYACQTYLIQWTATGTSNFYDIDFSLNNGTTWASITSNLNITNGQYLWTVPNVESSTCLVRVKDKNDALKVDVSNAVFTIHIPVVVTSPNGGEIWQGGTNLLITWDIQGTSLTFNLDYSVNGGTSWLPITTNLSTSVGSYNWLVANNPSANCLVRVRDAVTNCMQDISNNAFTITPAQPILLYPNGGEQFTWDEPTTITWNAATFYSPVRLEYSLDNGTTWQLINSGATNNGATNWIVPRNTGNQVLIKASNSANVSSNDVSNAVFSILKPLNITAPNGGESLLGCNTYTVSINKTNNTSGIVYVEYSTDAGATWNNITNFNNTSNSSPFTTSWVVPNGISSTQCLVRAYNTSVPTMADTSNAFFTIQPNNVITVTAPNGGEVIPALSNYVITWTNTAGASGLYNVQYSSNNGSTWNTLAIGISGNTYNWTAIPNVPTTTYLVRVQDNANTCKSDVSNANFTVSAAQPILTYPNGGEQLWSGTINTITWNAATFYSPVRLEYSLDNGTTWQVITTSTTNNGTFNWTTINANSAFCLIKASNAADINSNDISNEVFTILPAVKVLTPNGLEQLGVCTQTTISFNHSPAYSNFNIDYSINGGVSWIGLITNQVYGGTTGSYNWTLNNINTIQALVRVYPTSNLPLGDLSDSNFTIKPAVTLIQPKFGGSLSIGTTYPVKWISDGITNLYDIAYSTTGNTGPWVNIVLGYNSGTSTYNWSVPNTSSSNCFLRIRDNTSSCKEDISILPFTIIASSAPLIVTNPNGLDTLQGCQNYTITWSESAAPLEVYNIDLSTNGGTTWSNVVTNYNTTTGTYNWVVPNVNTDLALIRVTSSVIGTILDLSNAAFSIRSRRVIATPDVLVCSGASVQLNAIGGLGNYSWSPTTVLNNPLIANPVANPVTTTTRYVVSSTNGTCVMKDTLDVTVQSQPTVTVVADTNTICGGQSLRFRAITTNKAATNNYQWKLNGTNIGTNDSSFTSTSLLNGDVVSCVFTPNTSCYAAVQSNNVTITVNPKPNLGNDTTVYSGCANCTVNLNNIKNTTGYVYVNWNTPNPAAAPPGIYRVIVANLNGCACPDADTAYVYVNVSASLTNKVCINGNATFESNLTGTTYQWQVNSGSGYSNISNNNIYSNANTVKLLITAVPSAYYGNQYRCIVNGINSNIFSIQIADFWKGTVSTDWENPLNWACGNVPDKNTDVYIYGTKPNYPEVNCNRACRSVYVDAGTSLKVNSGRLLYITGK